MLARHDAGQPVAVQRPHRVWAEVAATLTYCTEVDGKLAAGFVNLRDMATPAALLLRSGEAYPSGRALSAADVVEEDWRLSLALTIHFS